jgi:hypothetical protein
MRRASVASCALVLCASLVAGCGASHQRGLAGGGAGPAPWLGRIVTREAGPEIAWHASPFFHIFPRGPATVDCRIPRGGPGAVRLRGRCTTSYVRAISPNSGRIRVAFVERWGHRSGGWVVTVGPSGRVLGFRLTGQLPPQLWM